MLLVNALRLPNYQLGAVPAAAIESLHD